MITCVIPYRERAGSEKVLKYVMDTMKNNVSEFVIVENDKSEKLGNGFTDINFKKVFIKSNSDFNKSEAVNTGVMVSGNNKIIIQDADIFTSPGYVSEMSDMLNKYDFAHMGREVRWLSKKATQQLLKNAVEPDSAEYDRHNTTFKGGSTGVSRNAFIGMGGMSEKFVGHGGEDTSFYECVKSLSFMRINKYVMYHMFHSRPGPHVNTHVRKREWAIGVEKRIAENSLFFNEKYIKPGARA